MFLICRRVQRKPTFLVCRQLLRVKSSSFYQILEPIELIETIKSSKFIARASPISSEADARRYVERSQKEYPKASHHCWAFLLSDASGSGSGVSRFSDDGEPSGTAGRPILTAIEAESLVDCVIVVTRYFGGIQLGTGGLARAYGGTARKALQNCTTRQVVEMCIVQIELTSTDSDIIYSCMQWLNSNHQRQDTSIVSKIHEESTGLLGEMTQSTWLCPRSKLASLRLRLHEKTKGVATMTVLDE